jgi:hypothetical protein
MQGDELPCQPACSGDADLLAKNSANCKFKTIPAAGCAKAGSPRNPRCKLRILGKMLIDGLDVCSDVKHASHPIDDCRQSLHISKADGYRETLLPR